MFKFNALFRIMTSKKKKKKNILLQRCRSLNLDIRLDEEDEEETKFGDTRRNNRSSR